MKQDRRRFLKGVAATSLVPLVSYGCGSEYDGGDITWLSAQGADESEYGLVASTEPFSNAVRIPTGFRGHDVTQHPTRPSEVVLFGRRPGTQSAVIDLSGAATFTPFESVPGYAFQGHGFFTPDGRHLVTAEADRWTGAGLLAVRDAETLEVRRVVETYGIGPHEIQLMPDRATVVIANGGLLTRPETGREVLNLDTMDSSLVYVDLATGELIDQQRVPSTKASIRHIDVTPDGEVAFGVQVQRDALEHDDLVYLCGAHRLGEELRLFESAPEQTVLLRDYVGSVAVSHVARVAGFSSPRGDIATFWNLDSGEPIGVHELADCSGLAASPDGLHFWLSSSFGEVRTLSAQDAREDVGARRRFEDVRWDNHLIAVVL